MAYFIDSHTHLHDREFFSAPQAEEMLKRAHAFGVRQIICIGTHHTDSLAARDFAETHEDVFWTYGIHPDSCTSYQIDCPQSEKLVGIGEVGLDYHYSSYDKAQQQKLLEEMLDLAIKLDLPVSFHVRDALPDFFAIFDNFPQLKPSVLHSFSDTRQNLDIALSKGLYLGVNGMATFANLDCYKDATPELLDHILLETDAPFLTPVPKRGIINESGYVKYVADYLANKLGVSAEEIAEKTTNNVRHIFNLPNPRGSQ